MLPAVDGAGGWFDWKVWCVFPSGGVVSAVQ